MYTSMKTISLDHPVRVYFKDGECYHDSAAIMIANGFPSFVRGKNPDVIYPWENVKHLTRVADEPTEPDLTERPRASVAAIADERNGAKQEAHTLRAEVERLQAENDRLKALHTEKRVALRDALGLTYDNHDHAGLCAEVKRIRAEWDHLRRYTSPGSLARLERELEDSRSLHTEHRQMLRAALGLRDDEATDNVTGDFKALCERVTMIRQEWSSLRTIGFNKPSVGLDRLAAALGIADADVDFYTMLKRVERLRAERLVQDKDLASITEQRDVLKRQIEELRAEMRKPSLPQPKQVEPGGPIWVRVVDTNSKHFGLVGRIVAIEEETDSWEQRWHVELEGGLSVLGEPARFAVIIIGTGRQRPGPNESPKSDDEHQQARNRDKWRATCLANGAKDCTVYFGPGDEVTIVVEMKTGHDLNDMRRALASAHNLGYDQYSIREVRPIVDGVKPSAFKHPADNGQP